jgi:MFS family permease
LRFFESAVSLADRKSGRAWSGSLLTLLIVRLSLQYEPVDLALGGGLLLGAIIGWFGSSLTKFEQTEEGHFYIPDPRLGIALSALLIGRVVYRIWLLSQTIGTARGQLLRSPLTLFLFGLLAGYYIVYYIGLVIYTRQQQMPVKRFWVDWLKKATKPKATPLP